MFLTRRQFLATTTATAMAPRNAVAERAPKQRASERFDPWVEVDAQAIAFNLAQIRRLSGRPVLAVVKNDAYGLGLTTVARILEPMDGIAGFAVVRTDEAITLRDAGVRKPVLLMARAAQSDVGELVGRGIELAVFADDEVARLTAPGVAPSGARIPVHFYIDSGMGRMGLPSHRALPFMRETAAHGGFEVRGTFTEFAESADFDREQLRRFTELVSDAHRSNIPTGRLHAASSNGVFHLPDAHLDLVRPGIALYGGYPSRPEEERVLAELRPAVRLRARVVRVERLRTGDGVSYGRNYVAQKPVWTATLPVGHSDGYPRRAVNGARVLIAGRLFPVIGAVSASHCIVEVGDEPAVGIGDVATFLGPDHAAIQPNVLAETTGSSVYDLFMHLSPSLPRFVV